MPFSWRELDDMATGRRRHDWSLACSLFARLDNYTRGKGVPAVQPPELMPFDLRPSKHEEPIL